MGTASGVIFLTRQEQEEETRHDHPELPASEALRVNKLSTGFKTTSPASQLTRRSRRSNAEKAVNEREQALQEL